MNIKKQSNNTHKVIAWLVHILTASGAALGIWAIISIFENKIQFSLWLMAATIIIDAIDGTLARSLKIKEHLPGIDGALLDNIVDYFTWTIVPFIWGIQVMHLSIFVAGICVMAALFGFSNIRAKTEDHFFTGFPNYWNLVIFHLYALHIPAIISEIILLTGAILIFVPIKWVYPSRTIFLRKTTLSLAAVYAIQLIALVWMFNNIPYWLAWTSLLFPVYYIAVTIYVNNVNSTGRS